MTDQHDASGAWPSIEDLGVNRLEDVPRCILELRSRIEALEAAQLEQAESQRFCVDAIVRRLEALEAAQHAIRSGPESPLVERVADAIAEQATSAGIVNDRPARAAIREVAAWIQNRHDSDQVVHTAYEAASWLRIEANRG
jgi:hypothetical protein